MRHYPGIWTVDVVPMGNFPRATREGLAAWLAGRVEGYQPRKGGYDAVIVSCEWRELVPIVKEQMPKTPIIHLGHSDEAPAGIAAAVEALNIKNLLPTIERLLQPKQ